MITKHLLDFGEEDKTLNIFISNCGSHYIYSLELNTKLQLWQSITDYPFTIIISLNKLIILLLVFN